MCNIDIEYHMHQQTLHFIANKMFLSCQHTEVDIEWPKSSKRYFQMHFLNRNCISAQMPLKLQSTIQHWVIEGLGDEQASSHYQKQLSFSLFTDAWLSLGMVYMGMIITEPAALLAA